MGAFNAVNLEIEMIEKKYFVYGLAPAISTDVNKFMKVCALGGEGAFVKESTTVTLKLNSPKNMDKIPSILKQAYEIKHGWHDVNVQEL